MENSKYKSLGFKLLDIFYVVMMVLPIVVGIVIKILTEPASEGINVTGARILFTLPTMPLQPLIVSEAQINSALVLVTIFFFCLSVSLTTQPLFRGFRFLCLGVAILCGFLLDFVNVLADLFALFLYLFALFVGFGIGVCLFLFDFIDLAFVLCFVKVARLFVKSGSFLVGKLGERFQDLIKSDFL
jgi:hypothetical protein